MGEETVSRKPDEVSQPIPNLPPQDFIEILSPILIKDGVPSYLVHFLVNYVYQLVVIKCKTYEQIFDDFTREAMPLVKENLQKRDAATIMFTRKYLLGNMQMNQENSFPLTCPRK